MSGNPPSLTISKTFNELDFKAFKCKLCSSLNLFNIDERLVCNNCNHFRMDPVFLLTPIISENEQCTIITKSKLELTKAFLESRKKLLSFSVPLNIDQFNDFYNSQLIIYKDLFTRLNDSKEFDIFISSFSFLMVVEIDEFYELYHSVRPTSLLLMILSLVFKFSPIRRLTESVTLYKMCKNTINEKRRKAMVIQDLQIYLLMGIYEYSIGKTNDALFNISLFVRSSLYSGINFVNIVNQHTNSSNTFQTDSQEIILQKKLWRMCLEADLFFAYTTGNQLIIHEDDYTILPESCDTSYTNNIDYVMNSLIVLCRKNYRFIHSRSIKKYFINEELRLKVLNLSKALFDFWDELKAYHFNDDTLKSELFTIPSNGVLLKDLAFKDTRSLCRHQLIKLNLIFFTNALFLNYTHMSHFVIYKEDLTETEIKCKEVSEHCSNRIFEIIYAIMESKLELCDYICSYSVFIASTIFVNLLFAENKKSCKFKLSTLKTYLIESSSKWATNYSFLNILKQMENTIISRKRSHSQESNNNLHLWVLSASTSYCPTKFNINFFQN